MCGQDIVDDDHDDASKTNMMLIYEESHTTLPSHLFFSLLYPLTLLLLLSSSLMWIPGTSYRIPYRPTDRTGFIFTFVIMGKDITGRDTMGVL